MKSSTAIVFGLLVMLFTAGCGEAFQGSDAPPGDAGEAGDGAMAGAGGDSNTGGTSQGGSSGTPAVTGGAGAVTTGGTAGAPVGGAAGSSGDAGSAGEATGGSGGTAPSCAPEDAIVFPESFAWDGYSVVHEEPEENYCASATGASCTFRNESLNYKTSRDDGAILVDFSASLDCTIMGSVSGICGEESACDLRVDPGSPGGVSFRVIADGNGYRLDPVSQGGFGTFLEPQSCSTVVDPEVGQIWSPGNFPVIDFRDDFNAFVTSQRYACP